MSAFLGPIHYWLYNKIRQQQAIVDELYILGEKNGLALEEECSQLYGEFENKPLEEMIDHGNIHGWLQERVSQVEYKYAYCVTRLLQAIPELMASVKAIVANNGTNTAIFMKEYPLDAAGVYKIISDFLLDGMPCDHANQVIKQSGTEMIWKRTLCVHTRYWDEVGGDIKAYYELRDAWIEALTKELGFLFEKSDTDTYCIKAHSEDGIGAAVSQNSGFNNY
ncbi:MAG TPA: hypothetical protein VN258_09650 [Mobilitalea sp.]|nr:hypothetical protein [Mobilitalea sp.]